MKTKLKTERYKEESKALLSELNKIRKQKNITQKQVATIAGFDPKNISRMFNVKNSPLLKNVIALADAVKCDLKIVKRE